MITGQNAKILLVDDEPNNLKVLRQIFKRDYRLSVATSGAKALELIGGGAMPDLVLLDIMMPEMDGYEVCRRLKENSQTAQIPIIFITAMDDEKDEQKGFDMGAVDYITKPVSASIAKARVKTHLSLVQAEVLEKSYSDAIHMLGEAGHYNDADTGYHIWRMAAYARAVAELSGWSPLQSAMLEMAAPMHDTGKIGTPDRILKKPGKLDKDDWVIMKQHCRIGHDILSKSDAPVSKMAAEIALNHHEKWDGSGYPYGLRGEAIPESARIVAIVDVFDALTMKRPYKDAWPIEKAVNTIVSDSGKHFDPHLVEIFQDNLDRFLTIKSYWDQKG